MGLDLMREMSMGMGLGGPGPTMTDLPQRSGPGLGPTMTDLSQRGGMDLPVEPAPSFHAGPGLGITQTCAPVRNSPAFGGGGGGVCQLKVRVSDTNFATLNMGPGETAMGAAQRFAQAQGLKNVFVGGLAAKLDQMSMTGGGTLSVDV